MANTNAIWQQGARTNYDLVAQQDPHQKAWNLTKKV